MGWENEPSVHRGYFELKKKPDFIEDAKPKSVGYGRFPPMPPEIATIYEEQYKNVAQDKKFQEIGEIFDKKSGKSSYKDLAKRNRQLLYILKEKHGYSYDELMHITGLNYNTLRNQISLANKENNE